MKDSFSENRGPSGWNAINRVMAEAIKHLPESPEDPLGPLNLRWSLAVGEEMAARSRVVGRTAKTLVVEVAGNEWIPVFKSYDKKIREKLNKMFDIKGVTSIKYKLAAKIPQPIPQTVKIQTANTYDRPMNVNYDPEEASLTSIQDSQLRDSLVRLSGKFRFISVVLAGLLFLANCAASTPQGTLQQGRAVESKAPPPPNSPYAVRQVYKLQKRHPEKNYRDPRAYYHFLKAFKYERDGDFDNASRHYALVVQYDPARESMHTHLVGLYLRTGQFNLALEAGENTLRRFPNNVRVRMIMGDILSSQGKYEEALNHYNKIMKLEPFNFRAFLLAGYNLKLMKQYDEAHDLFRKATVVDPSNPLGYHYLGSSLARSGEMENAEEKFRKSLTLRPSFIEAREN
ncbi:MAG: DUF721 domain-containing protein, partial [Nitrospinaceae bacterium]|nr:DUF721 domain-containing protein [Nitrospinaceae bacterium]NIR55501.1 DUF721 domain-containing protein [Nitrospinaceae bacterium]NIS85933.1 DUF721 domain-containing protein [Nitrospinaceae bacterium]NIT82781.1 DUF721 domain-containing protein [Nitrospinaceae bacterium]NIU44985.1 DUF721 domain-containing protein [Nitrospinaceae bacterium]